LVSCLGKEVEKTLEGVKNFLVGRSPRGLLPRAKEVKKGVSPKKGRVFGAKKTRGRPGAENRGSNAHLKRSEKWRTEMETKNFVAID
jgi:hypothetical protein